MKKISGIEKVVLLLAVLASTSAPAALKIKHFEFDCERTTSAGREQAQLTLGTEAGRMKAEFTSKGITQKGQVDPQFKAEALSGLNFRYQISKTQDILIEESMSRSGGRLLAGAVQGGHMAVRTASPAGTNYKVFLCTLK